MGERRRCRQPGKSDPVDAVAIARITAREDDLPPGCAGGGVLALTAGQDVEPAHGSDGTDGWWRIAREVVERSGDLPPSIPKPAAVFGAVCRGCPLRPRCTTSATGRSLNLHPHDTRLRHARRDWRDNKQLREVYRQHRPMAERSIAGMIGPKGRCRKLRSRGVTAGDWWLHTRLAGQTCAACSTSASPAIPKPGS